MDELSVLTWRIPDQSAAIVEAATLPETQREETLFHLREALGASEMIYLPTCQRVALVLLHAPPDARERARQAYEKIADRVVPLPAEFRGRAAFHHLAHTAASLDSLVVGEPQILGQVKAAAQRCDETRLSGAGLRHVMGLVLRAAKTVRSQTDLFRGKVSLVPLTEQLVADHLAGNANPRVAVLGTGQIGERMMDLLGTQVGVQLHVVSRDPGRAHEIAHARRAIAHTLEDFLSNPPVGLDVIALAMNADAPILHAHHLARLAHGRGMLVLDLAIPRNAEAVNVPDVRLVQMDELSRMSEEAKRARSGEIEHANRILDDELDHIETAYEERKLAHDLEALTRRFHEIADERWANSPGIVTTPEDAAARKWYDQTIRALLHEATKAVKNAGCDPKK